MHVCPRLQPLSEPEKKGCTAATANQSCYHITSQFLSAGHEARVSRCGEEAATSRHAPDRESKSCTSLGPSCTALPGLCICPLPCTLTFPEGHPGLSPSLKGDAVQREPFDGSQARDWTPILGQTTSENNGHTCKCNTHTLRWQRGDVIRSDLYSATKHLALQRSHSSKVHAFPEDASLIGGRTDYSLVRKIPSPENLSVCDSYKARHVTICHVPWTIEEWKTFYTIPASVIAIFVSNLISVYSSGKG